MLNNFLEILCLKLWPLCFQFQTAGVQGATGDAAWSQEGGPGTVEAGGVRPAHGAGGEVSAGPGAEPNTKYESSFGNWETLKKAAVLYFPR